MQAAKIEERMHLVMNAITAQYKQRKRDQHAAGVLDPLVCLLGLLMPCAAAWEPQDCDIPFLLCCGVFASSDLHVSVSSVLL